MNEVLIEIGVRIRDARRKSSYTLESLATELGVSRQSVIDWETAKSRIQVERIPALAKLLSRPIGWFFGEDGATIALPAPEPDSLSGEARLVRIEAKLDQVLAARAAARQDAEDDEFLSKDAFGRPYPGPEDDANFTPEQKAQRMAARMPPGSRKNRKGNDK